jgi:cell division septation protein DedD
VRSGAPGWIQTFVGALVLLGVGFGIGLLAGGALEEPELVARHVAGETVEAPLPDELPAAGSVDPLASALARVEAAGTGERPLGAAEPSPAPSPEPPAADAASPAADPSESPRETAASPPAVASAPAPIPPAVARTGFSVQVGAFSDASGARKLVQNLESLGFSAYVAEVDVEGRAGARYRVRVGPFSTRDAASAAAGKLHAEQRLPTWVLAEEGA